MTAIQHPPVRTVPAGGLPPPAGEGSASERAREAPPRTGDLVVLCTLLAVALAASLAERIAHPADQPPELPVRPLRIDVNSATADELAALPGVGPHLARRIAEERGRGGPYRSAGDLRRVPGIGPVAVARLSPYVAH